MDDQQSLTPDAGTQVISLEGEINAKIAKIEEVKEELKLQNEMLASYLNGVPEFVEADKAAKEASKKKTGIKTKLLQAPAGLQVANKVSELKDKLKTQQDKLSESLQKYQAQTGQDSFEGEDGEVRQIVYVAKLVRRTQFQK